MRKRYGYKRISKRVSRFKSRKRSRVKRIKKYGSSRGGIRL